MLYALLITEIIALSYMFGLKIGITISILTTIILAIYKKNIFLFIIPLLFVVRFSTSVDFTNNLHKNVVITAPINYGKGKIEKINNRFPKYPSYVRTYSHLLGDYEISGNLVQHKKYKSIYFDTLKDMKITKLPPSKLRNYFTSRSEYFINSETVPNKDIRDMYFSVVLGEQYRMNKITKNKFRYLGLTHIFALSGMHIGLVFLLIGIILKFVSIKSQHKSLLFFIIITLYYLGVVHTPSLTRAYIMGSIFILAPFFHQSYDIKKSLIITYIISLFIEPTALFNLGFRLSFIAVFVIIFIYPLLLKRVLCYKNLKNYAKLIAPILLAIVLQLFLLPVVLMEVDTIMILTFIANILVVPLAEIFITFCFFGLLLSNIFLGFLTIPFIKISYYMMMFVVNYLIKIPYITIKASIPYSNYFYIIYFIVIFGILYLLMPKKSKRVRIQ